MNILVLGASGMIGNAMFCMLSSNIDWQVWGTSRAKDCQKFFPQALRDKLLPGVDVQRPDDLVRSFASVRPDVVVNCIGLTKHHAAVKDMQLALSLNAVLPHSLADLCAVAGARLIHVSTDCVFDGIKGNYVEDDAPNAVDVYGKTKYLGEVDYPHAITLRTSTIGHELQTTYGLLEWFLSQKGSCKGFSRAIFSGLTNTEFARMVRDVVIPRTDLNGLYHVGAEAIDKYELLQLIAEVYGKQIQIVQDTDFVIDRSLNSNRFCQATGYSSPAWPKLIESMHGSHQGNLNV